MLTLRELKDMVETADRNGKQPTAKVLVMSGVPIVVKEVLDEETEVTVYGNGYVLYRVGKYATVFPLHGCGDYVYAWDTKVRHTLGRDVFEDENWYIRLILEGEDRLEHNQDSRSEHMCLSYSAVSEDWAPLGSDGSVLDDLIREEAAREMLEGLLSLVTEKQGYVLVRKYIDGADQAQIAEELGTTQQAVSDIIRKAKRRVARKCNGKGKERRKK